MEALDMPLDSLVKKSKISRGGRLRRGRGRGGGGSIGGAGTGSGRIMTRGGATAGTYLGPRSSNLFRKGSRYRAGGAFGISKLNRGGVPLWPQLDEGARLYVSNLDSGVSNDDIKELFSEIGDLKQCSIHYDKLGRSKGTAEVYFARKDRALVAMKQYNNVQLDGKPMVIDMIGGGAQLTNGYIAPAPRPQRPFPSVMAMTGTGTGTGTGTRGGAVRRATTGRGGGRGGRGRGRGRGRGGGASGRTPQKSLEELNAELDKYHSQAVDVNVHGGTAMVE